MQLNFAVGSEEGRVVQAVCPLTHRLSRQVKLGDKMDVVWSFVRSHVKAKTIVFLSTCKQVG